MKSYNYIVLAAIVLLSSCNEKKYTEVVEVPLPSAEEKAVVGNPDDVKADPGTFQIVELGYPYDALSPNIDARTMEIHYSKHYLTYTNNLNRAIEGTELESLRIEEILKKSDASNPALRNNAGGYYNHNLFWQVLTPKGGEVSDTLSRAIARDFQTIDNLKAQLADAAEKQFGSGWAWLITDRYGKLQITTTPNQDNPLMPGVTVSGTPILAIDVWEHAYYLDYQYRRRKYIDAVLKIINWEKVSENYEDALRKKYN